MNKYLNLDYNIILIYPIPQFQNNVSGSLYELYYKDKKNFLNNISKEEKYISLDYDKFSSDVKSIIQNLNYLERCVLLMLMIINDGFSDEYMI